MKFRTILELVFFVCTTCYSQTDSNKKVHDQWHASNRDFVIKGNKAFVVNDSGKVVIWSLTDFHKFTVNQSDHTDKILSIAKDRNDQIYLGTEKGNIYQLNSDLTFSLFLKIKYAVRFIFFNTENRIITIVPDAIYDPVKKKYWTKFENHTNGLIVTKKILGLYKVKLKKYFVIPQYAFIDNKDRIWMTANYGEFGGALQIFDAKNLKVLSNKYDSINPSGISPRSVFEGENGDIFITCGLQHFMNSGEIYRIQADRSVTTIFRSSGLPKWKDRKSKEIIDEGGLFIGPGTYNKQDRCIYFASSRGFYKASLLNGHLDKPKLLFNPELNWSGEPLAIGVGMAIKRLEFTNDDKLVFLTTSDGIGVYVNGKANLLK